MFKQKTRRELNVGGPLLSVGLLSRAYRMTQSSAAEGTDAEAQTLLDPQESGVGTGEGSSTQR